MTPEYGPPALIAKLARASAEGMDLLEKRIEMLVDHRVQAERKRCARLECREGLDPNDSWDKGFVDGWEAYAAAIREGEKDG